MTQPQRTKKPAVLVAAGCAVLALSTICCCGGGLGWRYWSAQGEAEEVALSFATALKERRLADAYAMTPPSYRAATSLGFFESDVNRDLSPLTSSLVFHAVDDVRIIDVYNPRFALVKLEGPLRTTVSVKFNDDGAWVDRIEYVRDEPFASGQASFADFTRTGVPAPASGGGGPIPAPE